MPKLSDVLFDQRQNTFASLAPMPSNVEAIEAGLLFATGLSTFVALVGPTGWGKSHILEAIAARLRLSGGVPVERVSLAAYLAHASLQDCPRALLLDDAQEVFAKGKLRQQLRVLLERRVRAGRPTALAFTAPKVSRQIRALLPSPREWTVAGISAPAPEERGLLLNQMCQAEGLALSAQLSRVIAFQMHGNGRTIVGALKRLRLSSSQWLDAKSTLQACGLLDPFFADNCEWDLKDKILRTAEAHRAEFSRVSPKDLALYTMLNVAGLSEAEVARVAGVTPAQAYGRATKFRKMLDESAEVRATLEQFVERVVASLAYGV